MSLCSCIIQIFFSFLPFNKTLGWCRCGQHYIWWDNSTSHSSWKGLHKIGSSSQSSRYGNRSLLETSLSQWQFKLKGCKAEWTCLNVWRKSDVKSKKVWISSESPALRCYTNHSSAPSNGWKGKLCWSKKFSRGLREVSWVSFAAFIAEEAEIFLCIWDKCWTALERKSKKKKNHHWSTSL